MREVSSQDEGVEGNASFAKIALALGEGPLAGHEHGVGARPGARHLARVGADPLESVIDERHLRCILPSYVDDYHRSGTHLSLGKDSPVPRPVESAKAGEVIALPQVGGLHHRYERPAA